MRPLTPPDHVIACAGNRIDSRCAEAMERIALCLPYLSIRFVDITWLAPIELASVVVCWVVDVDLSVDQMQSALQVGSPFLVPAERPDLEALSRPGRCYIYETSSEAAERIAWILSDGSKRAELSQRARSTLTLARTTL
jgi:hypothetical protein